MMKCPKCQFENPPNTRFCGNCGTKLPSLDEISITRTKTLPLAIKDITIGDTFVGRYQIVEELGRGGMGTVYKVIDTKINELVALKLLNPEIAADKKTIERFQNELKYARRISHRNVCRMFDFNEEREMHYITMEYVPGENLKTSVKRMGQLTVGKSVSIAIQVCEGLAEAHSLGVVHRDLKSQNIMLDREGNARVMDFGIARSLKAKGITDVGVIIGTPEYMSPEQVEGEEADQRSDIYSLGVILYEMATGRVPFEGDTALSIAVKHKSEEPPDPRKFNALIPEDLSRVILRCMEKKRENRYQRAEELLSDLKKIKRGIPTTERIIPKRKTRPVKMGRFMRRSFFIYGGAALLILILLLGGSYLFRGKGRRIDSIAVLPLENLSGEPGQEYFADGMTEELISHLTQLGALQRVISRTSVMQYKERPKPLPEIARELNVDAVVEGSVMLSGERVRITVQLIEARTDRNIWSKRYERDISDILTLQREVAQAIAREIKIVVTPAEQALLSRSRSVNPEAYQHYLEGRFFWNKRTEEGLKKAIGYFSEAIEKDPAYALAYVGLADAYNMLGSYDLLPPHEAFPKAKSAALKALERDENLAEAYTSLAYVKERFDYDWFGAETDYNWAIGLNPSYATAHQWYGAFLRNLGRLDSALQEIQRARELDPLSLPINTSVSLVYYLSHEYDKAIEQCEKTIEINPNFHWAHEVLAKTYIQKGSYKRAIAEFQKAVVLSGGSEGWLGELGHAYAVAGNREESMKILEELLERSEQKYIPKYEIALIYTALGEKELALEFLEKAYEERSSALVMIKMEPRFDTIRDDQRFISLLEKMGLE